MNFFKKLFGQKPQSCQFCRYVMVNDDGSVRELSESERKAVEEDHLPGDGPYIKRGYKSVDGWGNLSGFLLRKHLPKGISIEPAGEIEEDELPNEAAGIEQLIQAHEMIGDTVVRRPDGSIEVQKNPDLSDEERLAKMGDKLKEIASGKSS